ASERTFVIRNMVDDATISRTGVAFGAAGLTESGCTGEVEAGGHSLRWRLSFGQGAPAEDAIPAWLSPIARLRLSGYVLPHAKTTLSGAVEVDGRMSELQRMPALQGHLWGRSYWPAWAWARCSGFTEDPDASVDLLDVEGPQGVRLPLFVLRFPGGTPRFGGLPWTLLSVAWPARPALPFSSEGPSFS